MSQAWIVVADSARARIFEADSHSGSCSEIADLAHPASRAHERDLASDRPGRAVDRSGGARHAVGTQVAPHEHEAELFAREIAERLRKEHDAHKFKRLHLAAPPHFLGLLRAQMDDQVHALVGQVIDKDLVHETPPEIAQRFFTLDKQAKARGSS